MFWVIFRPMSNCPEDDPVSLVIPAHNEAEVIGACLDAAVPLKRRGQLAEVIVVDDGSTDATAGIIQRYPEVTYIRGPGGGPGAARNLGYRAASSPLVWFVDADCVVEPDALSLLRPHMLDPRVGGVSGSYGNMREHSLLACLIHEEIVARHANMATDVNFLATFNVLYRRCALEEVGGFDERFRKAQDAELAFRVRRAGYRLHFEMRSRVRHFHEDSLSTYLGVQRKQGYWRMWLYEKHPERMGGDSYSDMFDHVQPPLAVLSLACLPLGPLSLLSIPATLALAAAPLPMTLRLLRRTADPRQLAYAPFSVVRAYARGVGLAEGAASVLGARLRRRFSGSAS
ncbi:MAG: glycosyltransferase [Myxococcales bacterium]|nr:glycosyltransferase [Myxococcales bacterium]MDD9965448.1 glycosyltransferase [Myxococcales bacterium]